MRIYSDSTISDFLCNLSENQRQSFLNLWNEERNKRERVYISYDSTNKNCEAGDISLYKNRDASEKLFRSDKYYLGNGALRVASEEAANNKIFIGFIALIIRCRIYTALKDKAESILSALGVPASSAINMFYKQIILQRGLPFEVKIPSSRPVDMSALSEAELNAELEKGYADIKLGRTREASAVFADIRKDYYL